MYLVVSAFLCFSVGLYQVPTYMLEMLLIECVQEHMRERYCRCEASAEAPKPLH